MFKTNSNGDHLDYGSIAIPPEDGYRLDYAVGTTYSLDLEALVALASAFDELEGFEYDAVSPIETLAHLTRVSDKILIFADPGQIKVPTSQKISPLFALVDKMVVPVWIEYGETQKRFPAFHPKTWLFCYKNDFGEYRYRFAVLSRNLTFDKSFDVAFSVDGKMSKRRNQVADAMTAFMRHLGKFIPEGQKAVHFKSLQKRVANAAFLSDDAGKIKRIAFCPSGIGGGSYDYDSDSLFSGNRSFQALVIVSPFISPDIVSFFDKTRSGEDNHASRRFLITRRTELLKLRDAELTNFRIFVVKDEVVDAGADAGTEAGGSVDIHAKIYVAEQAGGSTLYLGSLNATTSALHRNTEAMMRMDIPGLTVNSFLKELGINVTSAEQANESLFEEVFLDELDVAETEECDTRDLDISVRLVALGKNTGKAIETGEFYTLSLTLEYVALPDGVSCSIAPLLQGSYKKLAPQIVFDKLQLEQLSRFFKIRVAKAGLATIERVIVVDIEGIPDEMRNKRIVGRVVRDGAGFLELLDRVLAGDEYVPKVASPENISRDSVGQPGCFSSATQIYERLLRAASESPDAVSKVFSLIDFDDIPGLDTSEFKNLKDVFSKVTGH